MQPKFYEIAISHILGILTLHKSFSEKNEGYCKLAEPLTMDVIVEQSEREESFDKRFSEMIDNAPKLGMELLITIFNL